MGLQNKAAWRWGVILNRPENAASPVQEKAWDEAKVAEEEEDNPRDCPPCSLPLRMGECFASVWPRSVCSALARDLEA